jgi:hypothetical protein
MVSHIENARQILANLEADVRERGKIWTKLTGTAASPENHPANNQWRDHESRCWIYASTSPEQFMMPENKDSEVKTIETADAAAMTKKWAKYIRAIRSPDEFDAGHLVQAEDGESLGDFIIRLQTLRTSGQISTQRGRPALHSFLNYLRQAYPDERVAFIEEIFPTRSEIADGRIKRLITPQRRPLSEEKAAAIIKTMIDTAIRGRPNSRKNCMEALALCWICLAVARLRHPVLLDDLYQVPVRTLFSKDDPSTLRLPTHFGRQQLQASSYFSRFLSELCLHAQSEDAVTLPTSCPQTLRRSLNRAIDSAGFKNDLKDISFLSFLSLPHQAGVHRR